MNGAEIIGSTINLVKPTLIRTTPDAVSFSLTLVGCCVRNIPRWYAAVKRLTWATSYKIPLWHSSESESFTHSFFSFLNFRNELTVTIVESKGITSRWCYYWRLRCQRSCPGIFGASLSKQLSSSPLFSVTFSRSMSRGSSIAPLTFGAIIHTTSQFIFEFFPRSLHQNLNFFSRGINPAENRMVAFLTSGEGWHNYHHVFPWDYKSAELGNYSMNATKAVIDFFAWIGWAYDLKTVPERIIRNRVYRTGDGSHPFALEDSEYTLDDMTANEDSYGEIIPEEH